MNHDKRIAQELDLQPRQVKSAIDLLNEGNTIPFIARYRKEMTFSLDELQLRQIEQKLTYYQAVDTRRDQIVSAIDKQGQLDDTLHKKLLESEILVELEDLYQPFKVKRKTRASKAIDAGLKPLADKIVNHGKVNLVGEAKRYITKEYTTVSDVLSGARDIVAQIIADDVDIKRAIREKALEWGNLVATKVKSAEDEKGLYRAYYDFSNRLKWIKPYQVLALNRGESEKILRVKVDIADRDWLPIVNRKFSRRHQDDWSEQLDMAIADSGKRLILPATERFIRRHLTEDAHSHAVDVFVNNVRGVLLQSPLPNVVVMGIDPGFRSGCKIAIIDRTGNVLETSTIYPNPPQRQYDQSKRTLGMLIQNHDVELIAIGNGTASRETELLVAEITKQSENVKYLIVSEAGASVYSASEVARQELPDLDVTLRGAVSIARRVQDPLAELVKIDPKSIGVGLYQHDLNQGDLSDALTWVVETVVNQVGVELNTSSVSLLKYVAGISESIANNIVDFREKVGEFAYREQLFDVSGIGEKTYEQCAGFLRIRDADLWMDASAIHPESYDVAVQIADVIGMAETMSYDERQITVTEFLKSYSVESLAIQLDVGEPTIEDILEQIAKPGRDPREDVPTPKLRSDILKMEDLQEGINLDGVVRNVVDFGAFIDIGVKQDGLLHSSKIPNDMVIQVGDVLKLEILSLNIDRGRIGLGLA